MVIFSISESSASLGVWRLKLNAEFRMHFNVACICILPQYRIYELFDKINALYVNCTSNNKALSQSLSPRDAGIMEKRIKQEREVLRRR